MTKKTKGFVMNDKKAKSGIAIFNKPSSFLQFHHQWDAK
jgi:hypothetical protein